MESDTCGRLTQTLRKPVYTNSWVSSLAAPLYIVRKRLARPVLAAIDMASIGRLLKTLPWRGRPLQPGGYHRRRPAHDKALLGHYIEHAQVLSRCSSRDLRLAQSKTLLSSSPTYCMTPSELTSTPSLDTYTQCYELSVVAVVAGVPLLMTEVPGSL